MKSWLVCIGLILLFLACLGGALMNQKLDGGQFAQGIADKAVGTNQEMASAIHAQADANKASADATIKVAGVADKLADTNSQMVDAQIDENRSNAFLAKVGSGAIAITVLVLVVVAFFVVLNLRGQRKNGKGRAQ